MARMVRCSLIQTQNALAPSADAGGPSAAAIKQPMLEKHAALIRQAAADGAQIVCLQEMSNGPYFCAEQTQRWQAFAEPIPDGPTTQRMMALAKELGVALVVPIAESAEEGALYNSAAVIGRDGGFVGTYRKMHIPHGPPAFWEKYYFRPGDLGFPVFDLGFCKIGVYLCYDRHFPEGARVMGLAGAEILFNPSAVIAGPGETIWRIEQPALAIANGYFVGAVNRVGTEAPWRIGQFFGQSYFCDPRGRIVAEGSRENEEVVTADLDLDLIAEVRKGWQFNRDRRPDAYGALVKA
ncbi:MAG TPA: nitrilase-related carbon-nitrogen hydrolase [Acidobacteriaceae bacterium]|nr:nitrilase-related carbon-nitrogen hydrolase [Acidobacteriaceae bacterium]